MKRKYQPHFFGARLTQSWTVYQTRLAQLRHARAAGQVNRTRSVRRVAGRGRSEGTRSSVNSGDGNSDSSDDSDPERRQPLQLYDQATLANLLIISKKSVQNTFSKTPWLLPPAIRIPGARGPRWTPASVQAWLSERPAHSISSTPAPAPAKRKAGRPRIALAIKGVQS